MRSALPRLCWLLLLCGLGGVPPVPATAPSVRTPASEAYLDPATGRFTVPHPAVAVRWASPRAEELAKREGAPLREVAGRTAAGGFEVALGDRFESRLVATVGEGGGLAIDCATAPAAGPAFSRSEPVLAKAVAAPTHAGAPAREER